MLNIFIIFKNQCTNFGHESAEEKADMIDQLKDALNKMRPFIAS